MRLGGPVLADCPDPETWVAELRRLGYRAAYCPLEASARDETVRAYAEAAAADIVIAEVGAWRNNPISPDQTTWELERIHQCVARGLRFVERRRPA